MFLPIHFSTLSKFYKKKHYWLTSLDVTANWKAELGASIFLLEGIHCSEWNAVQTFSSCSSQLLKGSRFCFSLKEYFGLLFFWAFSWIGELVLNKSFPKQEGSSFPCSRNRGKENKYYLKTVSAHDCVWIFVKQIRSQGNFHLYRTDWNKLVF